MPELDVNALNKLNDLLAKADLSSTTEDGSKSELPDGYYLCEVEEAKLTSSKTTGNPMVSLKYKVVENGLKTLIDDQGNEVFVEAKGTAAKTFMMNYVLTSEQVLAFFVSDMLKFSKPNDVTKPLLADNVEEAKLFFKDISLLNDALDVISMGSRIYIMVQTVESKKEPGKFDKKYNPITWKRAANLQLPM